MAMSNPNLSKLTAAQKAELKQEEQRVLAATKLAARNQNIAATQTLAYTQNLAGGVKAAGQAAVGGNKFIDTSAAPGYQGAATTGMLTNSLMGSITDPFVGIREAAIRNRMRVSGKGFNKRFGKALEKDYLSTVKGVQAGGGSGTSTLGYDLTTNTQPQRVLA